MTTPTLFALASALLAISTFSGSAAPANEDPLASYRWKARVLVVLAPDPADARLRLQKELFAAMKSGADERDLALVEAVGQSRQAASLRRMFDLGSGFQAMLVGKDGGEKLTSDQPLGPDDLFPVIDAMPMRQSEMRKR